MKYFTLSLSASHSESKRNTLNSQYVDGIDISTTALLRDTRSRSSSFSIATTKNIPSLFAKFGAEANYGFGRGEQAVNANVIKTMTKATEALSAELGKDNVEVYPIGRKVAEKARKMGCIVKCDLADLVDHPNVKQCIDLAMELGERFAKGEIDKVELIYHHFKSAGSQVLTHKTFLPIDIESELNSDHERDLSSNVVTKKAMDYLKQHGRKREVNENEVKPLNDNFIVEPDMHTVLSQLIPKMGHLMLYTALLDNVASEHAARMVAMQTATDNADELLRQLNLQYNKSRQQAITSELLDIVGGTVNN
jgi:F-type H+-transporting ATPase subunit gamma